MAWHRDRGCRATRRGLTRAPETTLHRPRGATQSGVGSVAISVTFQAHPDDEAMWGARAAELAVHAAAYVEVKRAAFCGRRSAGARAGQIGQQSMFLAISDDLLCFAFGTDRRIQDGQGPGITDPDVLAGP